ncbi:hypothetical protein [Streptomyces albireticuli]|uniref:Uncharacterized protein n=1 Tax=Streptomyces albireticuli TaxID=1940 RepID=A0A2A2D8T3_9ACTN|nr:hypothetical protein [Streptomyces albireticuli]MCD9192231.1 hypothetical protein [Streptomyces albireticuli]PAU47857.1 hypothetical protein CK936_16400 [Streptomyces albireticuli]
MIDQANPGTETGTNTAATEEDRRPINLPCPDCTHLRVSRHTAWLAGEHTKATDYTVLLRSHWRSVHRA